MIISLGFVRSQSQILIKDFNWTTFDMSSRLIDSSDLIDYSLQGLYINQEDHYKQLLHLLEKEKSHYPIMMANNDGLSLDKFEKMDAQSFKETYLKIFQRWTLHHNLISIEQMWTMTHHLRNLWKKDRLVFFEELWYWLKRNLGATEISIIFNDIISSEERDEQNHKKERPKLTQSLISGTKKANFSSGGGKEKELMHIFGDKIHGVFEVTEFNSEKGQLSALAQIEKSPIIFLVRLVELNQLQRTVFSSMINGLQ